MVSSGPGFSEARRLRQNRADDHRHRRQLHPVDADGNSSLRGLSGEGGPDGDAGLPDNPPVTGEGKLPSFLRITASVAQQRPEHADGQSGVPQPHRQAQNRSVCCLRNHHR